MCDRINTEYFMYRIRYVFRFCWSCSYILCSHTISLMLFLSSNCSWARLWNPNFSSNTSHGRSLPLGCVWIDERTALDSNTTNVTFFFGSFYWVCVLQTAECKTWTELLKTVETLTFSIRVQSYPQKEEEFSPGCKTWHRLFTCSNWTQIDELESSRIILLP